MRKESRRQQEHRKPKYSGMNDPREVVHIDVRILELPMSRFSGLAPIDVLEVLCRELCNGVKASLEDITTPREAGYLVSNLERTALHLIPEWPRELLPPHGTYPDLEFEAAKANVLFLSSRGEVHMEPPSRIIPDTPVAAERLVRDTLAWAIISEAWAGVSFAQSKANRHLTDACMFLERDGPFLEKAFFFLDTLLLRPPIPGHCQPNMSRFHEGLQNLNESGAFEEILRDAYGMYSVPLLVFFTVIREMQIENGVVGQISASDRLSLARTLLRGHKDCVPPTPEEIEIVIRQFESVWLEKSAEFTAKVFAESFLGNTPRVLAAIPVLTNGGQSRVVLCNSASEVTLNQISHDAIRGAVQVSAEVADLRRTLQQAGSDHVAWHQLELCGIQQPPNDNKVVNDRIAAFVAEGKEVGGCAIPRKLKDFDLILFHRKRKQLAVCECKYASAVSRTTDFRREFDKFGPQGQYWTDQVVPRVDWLRSHLQKIRIPGWSESLEDWKVEGRLLTNIVPMSVLSVFGDLPGIITVGSSGAKSFLFGSED